MIKINLLPHREMKRKARRTQFLVIAAFFALVGFAIVGAVGFVYNQYIDDQKSTNEFIKKENKKLDTEIAEIAKLKEEIEGLKARQKAVEDLQADRNLPVHMLDELVKFTPDGISLFSVKQTGLKVEVRGMTVNNARVADYLRNLSNNSQWLERPELQVIAGAGPNGVIIPEGVPKSTQLTNAAKRAQQFTLSANIKRAKQPEPDKGGAKPAAPAGTPAAVPAKSAAAPSGGAAS
jgi:type IV pilus assembly protein PilN